MVEIIKCDYCGTILLDVDIIKIRIILGLGVTPIKDIDCCEDCYQMKLEDKLGVIP